MQSSSSVRSLLALLLFLPQRATACGDETDPNAARVKSPTLDEVLLFQPLNAEFGNWSPPDLDYRDVSFRSKDGTRLHGWYCPVQNPIATILYLHGNAGNLSFRAPMLRYLQRQLRVRVLIFDYRGYGKSEGLPTVETVLQDAEAARKQLAVESGIKERDVVLMGRSLGGALAVQLAAKFGCRGLIVESSFASLRRTAQSLFPRLAWMVPQGKLNSEEAISRYRGPLLQSHGDADRLIPIADAYRVYKAAPGRKRFVVIRGGNHNSPQSPTYYDAMTQFLKRLQTDRAQEALP